MKALLIVLLGFPVILHAQAWQWGRSAGNNGGQNQSESVATDVYGNVYITGNFPETNIVFGTYTLNNSTGSGGIFLTKYDSLGNVMWAKNMGNNSSSVRSIATDTFGNIYMVGIFFSTNITFDHVTLTNNSPYNSLFLVKYNPSGNVIWARRPYSSDSSYSDGVSLSTDAAGDAYVTGSFLGRYLVFGTDTLKSVYYNSFVAKYDASGNAIWGKQSIQINSSCDPTAVASDALGNVYMTGYFQSSDLASVAFGNDTITSSFYDALSGISEGQFIVKYDALGNVQWAKCPPYVTYASISSISTDVSGNVFVSGNFDIYIVFGSDTLRDTEPLGGPGPIGSNMFLAKYNSSGNLLWATSATGSCSAQSLATDDSDNVYVTGVFSISDVGNTFNIGNDTFTATSGNDIFLAKYSNVGNLMWAATASGNNGDATVYSVATDSSGRNIYITGNFNTPSLFIGNDLVFTGTLSSSQSNIFLAKLNPTLPTKVYTETLPTQFASVFPNPTTDKLSIAASYSIILITITNIIGQTIYTHPYTSSQVQVDVSALPAGIYFIKINNTEVRKFVKQ